MTARSQANYAQDYGFDLDPAARPKPSGNNNPNYLDDLGYQKKGIWRSTSSLQNKLLGNDPSLTKRPEGAPVGLVNLGATCYINTLLQCLYMNAKFRKFVYQLDLKKYLEPKPKSDRWNRIFGQLQEIFAHLQRSEQSAYEPTKLIEALGITPHEQQDAQEFNKLLLNKLEEKARKFDTRWVQNFIPEMFQGEMSNLTTCRHCGYQSRRPSKFYELALQVKGMKSLDDSLHSLLKFEELTGSNQYLCSECQCKRDAECGTKLMRLPPVLNIQLIRFYYDREENRKRKVMDNFGVPVKLDMTKFVEHNESKENVYVLTAILYHHGTSANVGHYVIDTLEDYHLGKDWWHIDDQKVSCLGPDICSPIKKKVGVTKDADAEMSADDGKRTRKRTRKTRKQQSRKKESLRDDEVEEIQGKNLKFSRNAYMLVYVREDFLITDGVQPSKPLESLVKMNNKSFNEKCRDYTEKLKKLQDELDRRKSVVTKMMEVAEASPCTARRSRGRARILNRNWLKEFVTGASHCSASDSKQEKKERKVDIDLTKPNTEVPCPQVRDLNPGDLKQECDSLLCEHSKLCPQKRNRMKRISEEGWQIARKEMVDRGWLSDNYQPPSDADSCKLCCEKLRHRLEEKAEEEKKYKDLQELLKENPAEGGVWISRNWLKHWKIYVSAKRKAKMGASISYSSEELYDKEGFKIEVPQDITRDIQCKHGRLQVMKNTRRLISTDAWKLLIKYYRGLPFEGNARPCKLCQEDQDSSRRDKNQRRKRLRQEEKEVQELYRYVKGRKRFPDVCPPKVGRYAVVPLEWAKEWGNYLTSLAVDLKPPQLSATSLLCSEHQRPLYLLKPTNIDPHGIPVNMVAVIPLEEYEILSSNFGEMGPRVEVEFTGAKEWSEMHCETNLKFCEHCAEVRMKVEESEKLVYKNEEITVVVLETETPIPDDAAKPTVASLLKRKRPKRQRKSRQQKNQILTVLASSDDRVNLLKLKIFEFIDVSPAQQKLFYHRKELSNPGEKLSEAKVEAGSTLYLKIDRNVSASEYSFATGLPEEVHRGIEIGFQGSILACDTFNVE